MSSGGDKCLPALDRLDERNRRIAFRVRIGVTGHRDPADPDALMGMVRRCLTEIRDDLFPSTVVTEVAFAVLSSLADGADQMRPSRALATLTEMANSALVRRPVRAARSTRPPPRHRRRILKRFLLPRN
jgi:hypothetical protein